jgi:hypothetical protein
VTLFRRRRIDQATIAKLAEDNRKLVAQLNESERLADRRYDLLQAVYRENEALRIELCTPKLQLPPVPADATQLMTRQRSLSPRPSIDLTQPGDEEQLLTEWRPAPTAGAQ